MILKKIWISAFLWGGLALGLSASVQADDFITVSLDVASGGIMDIGLPKPWGSPTLETSDGVTHIMFGPNGPRKKPIFRAHIAALTANAPIAPEALMRLTQKEMGEVRELAAESNIPINDVKGENSSGHYFSITDRESKFGEYDYLTVAVVSSGPLLVKCFFFSNDGAPEFGEDAIRLMESVNYKAPPPPAPDADAS